MWKYLLGGLALFGGYEYYKHKKLAAGPSGGFTMTPGHLFAITYTGGAATPPTQAQANAALNASAPGLIDVVTTQGSAMAGSFVVGAVFAGPAQIQVTAAQLTSGWAKPNTIVAQSVQDMGAAPQQAQVPGPAGA